MEPQKPILFVASTLRIGGAEKILSDLILGITAYGYRPVLVCLKKLNHWGEYLRRKGVESYELGLTRQSDIGRLGPLIPISLRMKPRMIYCLDHRDAMFWSRLLAMLFRCPHVMSQHALNIAGAGAPDRRIYKFIIKTTAPLSSKIIACGNAVRDSLIRWGIPSAKIEVIQNGVAIQSGRPRSDSNSWRAGLKIPAETKLVGIVAALEPVKTHWVFLEAAQKVLKRFPQTRFVVVGDGFLRSRLEKKAHALGIADRVLFLGSVTPATEVIQALDIGVLSSASEAFPLVLLEYMEAGLPVVSTDSGGPAEIIQNGQSGFIVPVNHPDSMAEKVSYLLKFQKQARQMGRQGRQRVRECFSLEKMIARHISLFDRLTA